MLTEKVTEFLEQSARRLPNDPKLRETFRNCFASTLETTTKRLEDGDSFVFTGDIPAMWLRDSSAQVRHYIPLARQDSQLGEIIEGLIRRQMKCILIDPYANAFNEADNGNCWEHDNTVMNGWLWERKFEVDSLCYPVQLAYLYWKETGSGAAFDGTFRKALYQVVETFRTEQRHPECSPYRFMRGKVEEHGMVTETLMNDGKGMPVNYTGMIWSGFRPSDDACTFGYLIPSNMFASVILGYIMEFATELWQDEILFAMARKLRQEVNFGIATYGIYRHPVYGPVYAYETDGFGNYNLMDDANVPSLLSAPYLGFVEADDPVYRNTRRFILSEENPFYFEGKAAKGIGSPHTPPRYIWHIALSMQGLTAASRQEAEEMLRLLLATDAGCNKMHEGFHVDDPSRFTRPWFAWSNSLFAELVYRLYLEDK